MGNLIWKNNGWFINGDDQVRVGERIEVLQPDETWIVITVGKDANEVFHPEPSGVVFNTGMTVRLPKKA